MTYQLLAGGYRKTFTLLSFESANAKLKTISDSPAPKNASWLEPSPKTQGTEGRIVYSLSEDEGKGKGVSLVIKGDKVEVTAERFTNGAPAHVHLLEDGSGIIVANYVGGSAIYFPVEASGQLSQSSESPNLVFPFTYKDQKAPNEERQDSSHIHHVVEAKDGKFYIADLGSDRVWVVVREGESGLAIKGWLQAPPGAGPRHLALSPDEKHLYCLTELSHEVLIFSLEDDLPSHPKPDFKVSIIPPNIPKTHSKLMDSAEIQLNPSIPNIIYASNRLELHIHDNQKDLPALDDPSKGDAVAVILLGEDGTTVEEVKHVRTEADSIRAMRVSPDGKFVALAGMSGGGVEIWSVGGKRGDEWKLAAKEESINDVTDIVWL